MMRSGGRYFRDPATGDLTPAAPDGSGPRPATAEPAEAPPCEPSPDSPTEAEPSPEIQSAKSPRKG